MRPQQCSLYSIILCIKGWITSRWCADVRWGLVQLRIPLRRYSTWLNKESCMKGEAASLRGSHSASVRTGRDFPTGYRSFFVFSTIWHKWHQELLSILKAKPPPPPLNILSHSIPLSPFIHYESTFWFNTNNPFPSESPIFLLLCPVAPGLDEWISLQWHHFLSWLKQKLDLHSVHTGYAKDCANICKIGSKMLHLLIHKMYTEFFFSSCVLCSECTNPPKCIC